MSHVYPLLKRHIGPAQAVCQLLQTHVLEPILAGQPLPAKPPRLGSGGTLAGKIEDAVDRSAAGQDEPMDEPSN